MIGNLLITTVLFFSIVSCGQTGTVIKNERGNVGGPCETCEHFNSGMPSSLQSHTIIAGSTEPGERLLISGTIFHRDGRTPAPGVIMYLYQTDNTGHYRPGAAQTAGRRHGRLRGWIKTGSDGRYQFTTIRPAPYPGENIPAHIHPIIGEQRTNPYYIDEYEFEDDPLLTTAVRAKRQNRGGLGIIRLRRNSEGTWIGQRDIILGLNVPGY